jgi:hypothetical protein
VVNAAVPAKSLKEPIALALNEEARHATHPGFGNKKTRAKRIAPGRGPPPQVRVAAPVGAFKDAL